MPVWRDDWGKDGSVLVVAPEGVRGGTIREAVVILYSPRPSSERRVRVTDQHGAAITLTLPDTVLNGDMFAYDTAASLPADQEPHEGT
jgi:hypothetical protein